ncbi:MAG: SUMF1/EgtB/PvdO family nonheme iron enzyme, partial [Anaerolineae bacterium]|nr:SUMF1/EgtB/PvdO family nonheme iron enzyme [Anaerolineae bacterium]
MSAFTLPLLEWLDIPAGQVTLTDHAGTFEVMPFQIAKYPVTNAQFDAFIQDGGYKDEQWWAGLAQPGGAPRASDWRDPDCPKLEVCWYEAVAFGSWLAEQTGLKVRLPTEWEWQWAAVGASGWDYPYGSAFDPLQSNTKESSIGRTTAVTDYARATSPFGAVDMSGNVWEWCLNEGIVLQNCQLQGSENRALRGGSWNNLQKYASATFRSHRTPRKRTFNIGFRLIIASDDTLPQ